MDAPIVDAAAGALTKGLVDDRLGRALAVLSNDRLGAATPLAAGGPAPAAAPALAKNDAVAAFGLAQDALLDLRRALDDEDHVAAAAGFAGPPTGERIGREPLPPLHLRHRRVATPTRALSVRR